MMSETIDSVILQTQQFDNNMETLTDGMKCCPSVTMMSLFIVLLLCLHARCDTKDKLSPVRIPECLKVYTFRQD